MSWNHQTHFVIAWGPLMIALAGLILFSRSIHGTRRHEIGRIMFFWGLGAALLYGHAVH